MKTLALLFFFTAPVFAQVTTYTYSGQTLINGTWGPTEQSGAPPSPPMTMLAGTVTLSAPLNPNQANQTVYPVSWSFGEITSNFPPPALASEQTGTSLNAVFTFSTAGGQITGWAISITWNYGENDFELGSGTITSIANGGLGSDSWIGMPVTDVTHCGIRYECDSYSAYILEPGTWSINGTLASSNPPPPDPDATQIAALQAQVTSLQSQVATENSEINTYAANLQSESLTIGVYKSAYVTASANLKSASLTAAAYRTAYVNEAAATASYRAAYLKAMSTIASCRTHAGKC